MQNNFSYIASAAIDQGDLVAVDPSGSDLVSIGVKPAGLGDDILGRAAQKTPKGEPISINPLTVGETISVIAGDTIAAGDHLSAVAGKVVKGGSALLAIEGASVGQKLRAVMTASDQSPAVAEKAKALETNGQYVGGPDKHMYLLNTGVPVASSANVGSDSVPMYLKAGQFKACTSAGGLTIDSLTAKDSEGRPAVGSIALYEVVSPSTNLYYGDELEATAEGASNARSSGKVGFTVCGPLRINNGELSSAVTWQSQWGRKHLPVGAKIRLLNSPDSNGCVCLAVRIA